jgi:hypothetical protein
MRVGAFAGVCALCLASAYLTGCRSTMAEPGVVLRDAPPLELPGVPPRGDPTLPGGEFDCNNAVHWDGPTMYVFSSTGHPWRAAGPDLFHLARLSSRVSFDNERGWNDAKQGARWIEATHKVEGGPLYMWYHNEPPNVCPQTPHLTIPRIGAMVSYDNGFHWRDLGIVLEAPADSKRCDTANRYFAGGNGDFSVLLDRQGRFFYFLISTYNRDVAEQGVAIARMRYEDRDAPVGRVWKWCKGAWNEPGLGGHVTPILPPRIDWHRSDADAFWGPSVHWNTYLRQYVILLNRARDKEWRQEGIYVSFVRDIADPRGWTAPRKILDAAALAKSKWYPQVVGTDATARETDTLAGRVARLFVTGLSRWEIVFRRPAEVGRIADER